MLDNDTPGPGYLSGTAGNSSRRTLITLERSQKLDLLIHLLANLRKALIVCGPEGIGKTTLLNALVAHLQGQWRICLLQGSANLSFETAIINLYAFLHLGSSKYGFDLAMLRGYCENQKVVLIVDDAGGLVPGLIGELLDLSESIPGLSMVFSMTYDEFHIKDVTDKVVEDCHMIELPPLSQKQCGEFLQNLSAQPDVTLPLNAITEGLVAGLYRSTHGIPGKILAEMPKFNQFRQRGKSRSGIWLGMMAILLVAGWRFISLWTSPKPDNGSNKNPPELVSNAIIPPKPVKEPEAGKEAAGALVNGMHELENQKQQINVTSLVQEDIKSADIITSIESLPENNLESKSDKTVGNESKTEREPVGAAVPQKHEAIKPVALDSGGGTSQEMPAVAGKVGSPDSGLGAVEIKQPRAEVVHTENNQTWIMAQPPENFTLQLMVLSNRDSAIRFVKKHPQFGESLRYYSIGSGDQEKFVLIFGSFKTEKEARESKALLPNEFAQALEKRFRNVQKENRR